MKFIDVLILTILNIIFLFLKNNTRLPEHEDKINLINSDLSTTSINGIIPSINKKLVERL